MGNCARMLRHSAVAPQLGTPPMLPQARQSIQGGRAATGRERPHGLHPAERSGATHSDPRPARRPSHSTPAAARRLPRPQGQCRRPLPVSYTHLTLPTICSV
eukprot:3748360-Alexandrium_andersonii.AAC.1